MLPNISSNNLADTACSNSKHGSYFLSCVPRGIEPSYLSNVALFKKRHSVPLPSGCSFRHRISAMLATSWDSVSFLFVALVIDLSSYVKMVGVYAEFIVAFVADNFLPWNFFASVKLDRISVRPYHFTGNVDASISIGTNCTKPSPASKRFIDLLKKSFAWSFESLKIFIHSIKAHHPMKVMSAQMLPQSLSGGRFYCSSDFLSHIKACLKVGTIRLMSI